MSLYSKKRSQYLSGVSYRLGENKRSVSSIAGIHDAFEQSNMRFSPEIFGLGDYFQSENIYELIQESIVSTLVTAEVDPTNVSDVIISSAHFKHGFEQINQGLAAALQGCGIGVCRIQTLSGMGCVSLLSALEAGLNRVRDQVSLATVLVVNIDFLEPLEELSRFTKYAVVGDSVCSFLVSNDAEHADFEIASIQTFSSPEKMLDKIRAGENKQTVTMVDHVCRKSGVSRKEIRKLISNNVFLPFKMIKECSLGFSKDQLYLDNVVRIGHNYGSDTIINLYDCVNSKYVDSDFYLLLSEADGHYGACILKTMSHS